MNGFMIRDLLEKSYSNESREIDSTDRQTSMEQNRTNADGLKLVVGPPHGFCCLQDYISPTIRLYRR
jgi:hypothetical protein